LLPPRPVSAREAPVVYVREVIRPATRADVPVLVELIRELAEYERARREVEIDEILLARALFGTEPSAHAYVATAGEQVIGMALYYRSFSTWTG